MLLLLVVFGLIIALIYLHLIVVVGWLHQLAEEAALLEDSQ